MRTSSVPVFVDFPAGWCGLCKMGEPSIKKNAQVLLHV
nr:thioredoxin domain-containing protein [Chlorobium phaeobacteroides]